MQHLRLFKFVLTKRKQIMNNEQTLNEVAMQLLKAHFLGEYRGELAELKNEIGELKISIESLIQNGTAIMGPGESPVETAVILERFNICANTLATYRNKGLFPFSRIGKKYLYKISEVDKALESKRRSR